MKIEIVGAPIGSVRGDVAFRAMQMLEGTLTKGPLVDGEKETSTASSPSYVVSISTPNF